MARQTDPFSKQLVAMNAAQVRGSVRQHELNVWGGKLKKLPEKVVAQRSAALTEAFRQLLAEVHARRRMEREMVQMVEAERLRLGQELHDGLAQELTGATMILYTLEQKLKEASSPQAAKAHEVHQILIGVAKEARNLAGGLYPVELEKHGLVLALRQLAERTRKAFGVSCKLETGRHVPAQWNDTSAIQLFRIAQEAVHNAIKHARAEHIRIRVALRKDVWLLTVKDDGVGLRPTRRCVGGMGRQIMQHRAGLIGGTLEVRNADGGGVIVSCVVPERKVLKGSVHYWRIRPSWPIT